MPALQTTRGAPASAVLRARTRDAHERVEVRVGATGRDWLELMHAFHASADPALERAFPALPPSGRRERLRAELGTGALPAMPPLPSGPGALYVVEGSALGSAVVRRSLGLAPGPSPGPRWRAVRALIDGLGLTGVRLEAAAAEARATFAAFEEWACQ